MGVSNPKTWINLKSTDPRKKLAKELVLKAARVDRGKVTTMKVTRDGTRVKGDVLIKYPNTRGWNRVGAFEAEFKANPTDEEVAASLKSKAKLQAPEAHDPKLKSVLQRMARDRFDQVMDDGGTVGEAAKAANEFLREAGAVDGFLEVRQPEPESKITPSEDYQGGPELHLVVFGKHPNRDAYYVVMSQADVELARERLDELGREGPVDVYPIRPRSMAFNEFLSFIEKNYG